MVGVQIKRLLLVLGAISVYISLAIAIAIANGHSLRLDEGISNVVHSFVGNSKPAISETLATLGSTKGFVIVAVAVITWLVFKRKDYMAVGVYVFAVLSGYLLNSILKEWHQRPRPTTEQLTEVTTLSFPSGNSMMGFIMYSMAAYFLIMRLTSLKAKITVILVTTFIILFYGISRVILNVHYPSDILAGYALGLMWSVIWIQLYERYRKNVLNKSL
ncbi:phosphatase PAP2 family protein [Mesobacillus maritimus]|uniref:phosphatase PAP2 family protein n=1 Tax=Mesobacillus maritimus TaxID=1643336 RepID=UPI0020416BEA|nr:phosphatase PAP2 family protein [Mesobacillus maritimus]MCM3586070.1 phosphatase PAP2 family protein [Mesobacillus maritimus]